MHKVKYYSFYIGWPWSEQSEWQFDDIKLAGNDLRTVIMNYIWILHGSKLKYKYGSHTIHIKLRKIIEYERVSSVGKTRVNYRKTAMYTQFQIMELFDSGFGICFVC